MEHFLILLLSIWIPSEIDGNKMQKRYDDNDIGNEFVDIRVSSAIRQSNWELRSELENLNGKDGVFSGNDRDISTTDYEMNTSLMREYSLLFNVRNTNVGLVYAKNEARKDLGENNYAAAESLFGYLGIDDVFNNGGSLIARYKYETVGGLATTTDWSGGSLPPVKFESKHKYFMLAEEFPNGVFIGFSHNQSNLPMGVGFLESSGRIQPYFDTDVEIKSTKFVLGGSSTNVALDRQRFYKGIYSSLEFGLGLFTYDYSDKLKNQVFNRDGFRPDGKSGYVFGGNVEIGYAVHKRFESAYDLGLAFELGLSMEGDYYQSSSLIFSEEESEDVDIQFTRKDFRYGPIVRLTAAF